MADKDMARVLNVFVDLEDCADSMLIDSETKVAAYEYPTDEARLDGDLYVFVEGEVSVTYHGKTYECASDMPDELLAMFRTGEAYRRDDVRVDARNYFRVILVRDDADYYVLDELPEGGWKSEDELRAELDGYIANGRWY